MQSGIQDLATKNDIAPLKSEIAVIRNDMATKNDIAALKSEIAVIRNDMATKNDIAMVKGDLALARQEATNVETRMNGQLILLKWMISGLTAICVGILFDCSSFEFRERIFVRLVAKQVASPIPAFISGAAPQAMGPRRRIRKAAPLGTPRRLNTME